LYIHRTTAISLCSSRNTKLTSFPHCGFSSLLVCLFVLDHSLFFTVLSISRTFRLHSQPTQSYVSPYTSRLPTSAPKTPPPTLTSMPSVRKAGYISLLTSCHMHGAWDGMGKTVSKQAMYRVRGCLIISLSSGDWSRESKWKKRRRFLGEQAHDSRLACAEVFDGERRKFTIVR
jgi:hypothetical protein